MQQFYSLRKIAVMLSASFISYSAFSQCGGVVENFDATGGSTAGFRSYVPNSASPGFTYQLNGQNGYLQRCNIPAPGSVYDIESPTYKSATSQSSAGYGFELSGAVNVSTVLVYFDYVPANATQPIEQFVTAIVPQYSGNTATICASYNFTSAPGFTAGNLYRFRFEFIAQTTSNANQCIIFDNFRTTGTLSQITLPVTFVAFGANQTSKGIELIWNVTAERDVQFYDVERSSTGADFLKLGTVAAKNATAYTFLDGQPAAGNAFYRIKEVDIDGNFKYSPIVRLNLSGNMALRAYPSPATDNVTIEHSATGKGTISITTTDGRVVKQIEVKPQMTQTFINTSTLKAGVYMVRFATADGKTQTTKLVKQ